MLQKCEIDKIHFIETVFQILVLKIFIIMNSVWWSSEVVSLLDHKVHFLQFVVDSSQAPSPTGDKQYSTCDYEMQPYSLTRPMPTL